MYHGASLAPCFVQDPPGAITSSAPSVDCALRRTLAKNVSLFTVSVRNMGSRSMEQGAGSTQPIPNSEPMPTPGPEVSVVCEVEQERQPPGADGSEAFLHSALVSSGPTPKGGKKRKT